MLSDAVIATMTEQIQPFEMSIPLGNDTNENGVILFNNVVAALLRSLHNELPSILGSSKIIGHFAEITAPIIFVNIGLLQFKIMSGDYVEETLDDHDISLCGTCMLPSNELRSLITDVRTCDVATPEKIVTGIGIVFEFDDLTLFNTLEIMNYGDADDNDEIGR